MSTLKSVALAQERHRRAVARELLRAIPESITLRDVGPTGDTGMHGRPIGSLESRRIEAILDGRATFDVVAAKVHADRLQNPPPARSRADLPRAQASVRLGKRLALMLEGQPGKCENKCGPSGVLIDGEEIRTAEDGFVCIVCHGTGHNIRGKLPPLEWSPAVRRKVLEAYNERLRRRVVRPHVPWTLLLVEQYGAAVAPDDDRKTRTVPRGTHRTSEGERAWGFTGMRAEHDIGGYKAGERVRVSGYGKGRWRPRTTHDKPEHACTPRWRRGELEHSRQRQERADRRNDWHLEYVGPRDPIAVRVDTRRIRVGASGVCSAVLEIDGVDTAEVDENPTMEPANGIPRHSVRVRYSGTALPGYVHAAVRGLLPAVCGLVIGADVTLPGRIQPVVLEGTIDIE